MQVFFSLTCLLVLLRSCKAVSPWLLVMPHILSGGRCPLCDWVTLVSGHHFHGGMWQEMELWACKFPALFPCNQRQPAMLYYLRYSSCLYWTVLLQVGDGWVGGGRFPGLGLCFFYLVQLQCVLVIQAGILFLSLRFSSGCQMRAIILYFHCYYVSWSQAGTGAGVDLHICVMVAAQQYQPHL